MGISRPQVVYKGGSPLRFLSCQKKRFYFPDRLGWKGFRDLFFLLWWLPWRAERLTAQTLIISSCAFKWPNCLSCLSLSNWDFILNRNFQIFAQVFSLFWQIRCQVQTRSCGMFKDCVFFQSFSLWWGRGVSLRPNTLVHTVNQEYSITSLP